MTAWTLIQKVEVTGSNSSEIVLNSIPNTYNDLVVISSLKCTRATTTTQTTIRFNNSSSAQYYWRALSGGASGNMSIFYRLAQDSFGSMGYATGTSRDHFGITTTYISDYANGRTTNWISQAADSGLDSALTAGFWNNTSNISSIVIGEYNGSSAYIPGSAVWLYGITHL
jgi:hypothetical protein